MPSMLTMYDDTSVSVLPAASYYAGYVDGLYANVAEIKAKFPKATVLTIAVFASDDADCLDVEAGDATRAQIYAWFKRQQARGVYRPVVYSSVVNMDGIAATMTANGFKRDEWRAWSAHYGAGQHICGPSTCKKTSVQCDGTQWTSTALSRSLDESELLPGFFNDAPPKPPQDGPYRHVVPAGNNRSLWRIATDRNTQEDALIDLSRANLSEQNAGIFNAYLVLESLMHAAGLSRPVMPEGTIYYTQNE